MARLSQSQLAGFRVGTEPAPDEANRPERRRPARPPDTPDRRPETAESTPAEPTSLRMSASSPSPLGPIPPAPTHDAPRHRVGLTLPLDLAQRVRDTTQQGYGLADLIMVAYQHHRDQLLEQHQATRPRQLLRRDRGRSAFTIAVSSPERAALDALATRLGSTRSHAIAALLESYVAAGQPRT